MAQFNDNTRWLCPSGDLNNNWIAVQEAQKQSRVAVRPGLVVSPRARAHLPTALVLPPSTIDGVGRATG